MMPNSSDAEPRSDCAMAKTALRIGCARKDEPAPQTAPVPVLQTGRSTRAVARHDVHGVVLAGGRSSRMGTDKALLPLGHAPLIEHAIGILHRAGLPVSISGSRADLGNLAPVLADLEPRQGPLTGICSALHALAESWIVLLTVDMPLVPPALIARLLELALDSNAAAVLPSFAGRLHPFPCVLHRDLLPGLLAEYRSGRYGCLHAFSAVAMQIGKPIEIVPLESFFKENSIHDQPQLPIDTWMLNVNRPEDLMRAEDWLTALHIGPVLSDGHLIAAGESPCHP